MIINYKHQQSAHCENGVVSSLMRHHGLEVSEPMVFGIGSGLLFCYIPFLMVNHAPAITYRVMPGQIFNKFAKRLGIRIKREKFRDPLKAKKRLDQNLNKTKSGGFTSRVFLTSAIFRMNTVFTLTLITLSFTVSKRKRIPDQ